MSEIVKRKSYRKKLFIVGMLLEKIIFAILMVFVSESSKFFSLIVILYYLAYLILAIIFYPSTDKTHFESENKSHCNSDKNEISTIFNLFTEKSQLICTLATLMIIQSLYLSLNIAKSQAKSAS